MQESVSMHARKCVHACKKVCPCMQESVSMHARKCVHACKKVCPWMQDSWTHFLACMDTLSCMHGHTFLHAWTHFLACMDTLSCMHGHTFLHSWTHFLAFMDTLSCIHGVGRWHWPAAWSYVPVQSSSCSLRVFCRTLFGVVLRLKSLFLIYYLDKKLWVFVWSSKKKIGKKFNSHPEIESVIIGMVGMLVAIYTHDIAMILRLWYRILQYPFLAYVCPTNRPFSSCANGEVLWCCKALNFYLKVY